MCGGHIDRPQFVASRTEGSWTNFSELRSTPTRSGVLLDRSPLRVEKSSSCKRAMQPTAIRSRRNCHRCIDRCTKMRRASEPSAAAIGCSRAQPAEHGMQSQELSHLMSSWDFDLETAFRDSEQFESTQLSLAVGVASRNERLMMHRQLHRSTRRLPALRSRWGTSVTV